MIPYNHNKQLGRQDGSTFDLNNIMKGLQQEMYDKVKPLYVMCHVCDSSTSVRINPKKRTQHVECTWCKNILKFLIFSTGKYRVKSPRGIEEVVGNERKWIERNY